MRFRVLFVVLVLLIVALPLPSEAGDGVVALQTADPSCGDDSGDIYVGCGNGTVTDNRTGLVWLANANCLGQVTWYEAMESVAGLADSPPPPSAAAAHDCGLSDGSSAGEWRLPSIGEFEVMVADAVALGCDPTITDDTGLLCWHSLCIGGVFGMCSFTSRPIGKTARGRDVPD